MGLGLGWAKGPGGWERGGGGLPDAQQLPSLSTTPDSQQNCGSDPTAGAGAGFAPSAAQGPLKTLQLGPE